MRLPERQRKRSLSERVAEYSQRRRLDVKRDALRRVFLFPAIVIALGCVPVLNFFLYSGHGGIFWIVLPFCFPYILIRGFLEIRKLPTADRRRGIESLALGVAIYLAYPATRWTEHYITARLGLPIIPGTLFKLATLPLGLALPPY
jgi:hypothetical protein